MEFFSLSKIASLPVGSHGPKTPSFAGNPRTFSSDGIPVAFAASGCPDPEAVDQCWRGFKPPHFKLDPSFCGVNS